MQIKVKNKTGDMLALTDEAMLWYYGEYQDGDTLEFELEAGYHFYMIQVDDAVSQALIYTKQSSISYPIPNEEQRIAYSPKAFFGQSHLIRVRKATKQEISMSRNLACNSCDLRFQNQYYPHASANVETREEAVFFARNAIDGITINHSHGAFPFQSWGIGTREDAHLRIDFGRMVCVENIHLYLRADFPHDNWWKQVTIRCSNQEEKVFHLEKKKEAQILPFHQQHISWIELDHLIKSDDPSPFPALTQIEVYGTEEESF